MIRVCFSTYRIPNPESRTPNPFVSNPFVSNPELRIPNPELRTPNPEPRTPNSESRTPNSELRIPILRMVPKADATFFNKVIFWECTRCDPSQEGPYCTVWPFYLYRNISICLGRCKSRAVCVSEEWKESPRICTIGVPCEVCPCSILAALAISSAVATSVVRMV